MSSYFLYAEDDRDDADFLAEILLATSSKIGMICVSNGYELLQHLQQVGVNAGYPCLIILDLKMPRLGGLETLELLKTDDMYRLIPVVILTTKATPKDEASCLQFGADLFIKPNNFNSWNKIATHFCSYSDEA